MGGLVGDGLGTVLTGVGKPGLVHISSGVFSLELFTRHVVRASVGELSLIHI